MAEQLPFSCLCKAVVEKKKIVWGGEREREHAQNGEDRIMKIQELVYNRPNLIRSQVGSISTFGFMLQFRIFFFLQLMCVFSSVQAKSETEQCQCITVVHEREKESALIMCVFSLVLAYVSIYIFVCKYYVLVCVCVRQGVHICVTVSMCRRGVGVSCSDALQTSAWNCSGPCPVQKMARASHLQVKWPYPQDLHLGRQQQGNETGY